MAVDDVLHLADHASQPLRGQPELEDRKLHTLTVLLTDLGDAPEPRRPRPFRVGDVIGDKDVYISRHDERWVRR